MSPSSFYNADWYSARWESLSPEQRQTAIDAIVGTDALSDETKERIRAKHEQFGPIEWIHKLIDVDPDDIEAMRQVGLLGEESTTMSAHHGFGTAVRNRLRDKISDSELPEAPYEDGTFQRNWDDFYVQALEAAVGLRET